MFIYSIFDKKAISFSPVFVCENDEVAKRLVAINVLKDSMLFNAPGDFCLYCLGKFDSNNGDISGFSPIKIVCEILSLIKVDENVESK